MPRKRDATVPRCVDCGKEAIPGGPIVPSPDFIASVGQCSFGGNWAWCETGRRYSLWLPSAQPVGLNPPR